MHNSRIARDFERELHAVRARQRARQRQSVAVGIGYFIFISVAIVVLYGFLDPGMPGRLLNHLQPP